MAKRPAWSIKNDKVICREFDFKWNSGFSIKAQKQKNIANLHESIDKKTKESVLEDIFKRIGSIGKKYRSILFEVSSDDSTKYFAERKPIKLPVNSLQRL